MSPGIWIRFRLWLIGVLALVWALSVAFVLIVIGHNVPLVGVSSGHVMVPEHMPRVGIGWEVRLWFVLATGLCAVMLAAVGWLVSSMLDRRARQEHQQLQD